MILKCGGRGFNTQSLPCDEILWNTAGGLGARSPNTPLTLGCNACPLTLKASCDHSKSLTPASP